MKPFRYAAKMIFIIAFIFTFFQHDLVAKEQPLYVVSNDDCKAYLSKLSNYYPPKQRSILTINEAQSNRSLFSGNPAKEESSLFLINREKSFDGLEYFENLFGSDISNLSDNEIYIVLKPKGGKNPNAALLISAPSSEALLYSANVFSKKSHGDISDFTLREKFNDCYEYNEFGNNGINFENMYLPCKIYHYTPENISEFLQKATGGSRVYVLNSRTYKNLDAQTREYINTTLGDDLILPNTFLMTIKENPDNKDLFTIIVAAPNVELLSKETANMEYDDITKNIKIMDYPDFTTLRRVYIKDQTEGINELPNAGVAAIDVLSVNLKSLGFIIVNNKKDADVIAYLSVDSVSGKETWDAKSEKVTPDPTSPGDPPKEPSKTYRACKLSGCQDKTYTDEEYQGMLNKYYNDKVNYNNAINDYNNKISYGSYIWHWKIVKSTSVKFSGGITFNDIKKNEPIYTSTFSGGDTKDETTSSYNVTVTGAYTQPERPSLNPYRSYVNEDMYMYELVKSLGNWEKEFSTKAIMPDTSIEPGPVSKADSKNNETDAESDKLVSSLTPKITKIDGKFVVIDMGAKNGIIKGMQFELIVAEKVVKDPKTGAVIERKTTDRAVFKVSVVKENTATLFMVQAPKNKKAIVKGAKLKQVPSGDTTQNINDPEVQNKDNIASTKAVPSFAPAKKMLAISPTNKNWIILIGKNDIGGIKISFTKDGGKTYYDIDRSDGLSENILFDWSPDGKYVIIGNYLYMSGGADPKQDNDGFVYWFPMVFDPNKNELYGGSEFLAHRWIKKSGKLFIEGKPRGDSDKYKKDTLFKMSDYFHALTKSKISAVPVTGKEVSLKNWAWQLMEAVSNLKSPSDDDWNKIEGMLPPIVFDGDGKILRENGAGILILKIFWNYTKNDQFRREHPKIVTRKALPCDQSPNFKTNYDYCVDIFLTNNTNNLRLSYCNVKNKEDKLTIRLSQDFTCCGNNDKTYFECQPGYSPE